MANSMVQTKIPTRFRIFLREFTFLLPMYWKKMAARHQEQKSWWTSTTVAPPSKLWFSYLQFQISRVEEKRKFVCMEHFENYETPSIRIRKKTLIWTLEAAPFHRMYRKLMSSLETLRQPANLKTYLKKYNKTSLSFLTRGKLAWTENIT